MKGLITHTVIKGNSFILRDKQPCKQEALFLKTFQVSQGVPLSHAL